MTVKEFIEELQELEQDRLVWFSKDGSYLAWDMPEPVRLTASDEDYFDNYCDERGRSPREGDYFFTYEK
jgi:hypothetical protein